MLELRNITKAYKTKSGDVRALNNLSLTFPSTGLVFITGKSGCGKTTLLNVIGGLDDYDSGEILLLGKSFKNFSAGDLNDYRNTFIGFIFQEYNVLTEFSVEKNIEIAMELQGLKTNEAEVDELLKQVEIDGLRKRKPSELSGGQRQRLAIARALVKNPRIIMADEPTGALDSNTGIQVLETLKKLSKDKLIIVVSHDQEFAEKYADRIIRLVDGRIEEDITYNDSVLNSNVNTCNDKIYVKEGSDLSPAELSELASAIKSKKKIELVKNDHYRQKNDTEQSKIEKTEENVKMTKSKMKLKSSLSMGVKSLGVKPLRLIFTIFLSVIAFGVFGLFDTIANFTTESVVSNLLSSSSSVSLYSNYKPYENESIVYQVKMSEKKVNDISSELGIKVKGVYNFLTNSTPEFTDCYYTIKELSSIHKDTGTLFYSRYFNGFVEFDKSELDGKKFKDFNYTVVKGVYPTLRYTNGQLDESSLYEIAISSHIADSLIHYLSPEYKNYNDIINKGATITFNNNTKYKVVGIIDCGEIQDKYKQLIPLTGVTNSQQTQLYNDFESFMSSSIYRCAFAASGALDEYNKIHKFANTHYTGDADWTVFSETHNSSLTDAAATKTLASKHYGQDNMLFFDKTRSDYTLKDNEVLIHPQNLRVLLDKKYKTVSMSGKETIDKLIEDLSDINYNGTITKPELFRQLIDTIYDSNADGEQVVLFGGRFATFRVKKIDKNEIVKEGIDVVGIYYDINVGSVRTNNPYIYMMNDNLMNEFEICTDQGDYSRLLISPHGNSGAAGTIASYMSANEGFQLVWYNNEALSLVQDNESTIKQFSDLFLYVALVLAIFSVFMLFNYITMSIANKRHSTGILRALGANGKDIFSMFLIESLVIALINGIFAVALSAIGCSLVNFYIAEVMNIAIPFAIFSARQIFIILGISIGTAVISSSTPILRIVKEKPVNLIRRS